MKTPDDVLTFWFVTHGEADWFGAKPEFDAETPATQSSVKTMVVSLPSQ